jgi:hypothetical protein
LIDKRCPGIDLPIGAAGDGRFGRRQAANHVATHNFGDTDMTKILTFFDRSALTLINLLVVAGMPLAAVALVTNAL